MTMLLPRRDDRHLPTHDPTVEHYFEDGVWKKRPKPPPEEFEVEWTIRIPAMTVVASEYDAPAPHYSASQKIAEFEQQPERVLEVMHHLLSEAEEGKRPFDVIVNVKPLWQ